MTDSAVPKTEEDAADTRIAPVVEVALTDNANNGDTDDVDEKTGPLNFEDRILCPDGTCIGVLGPDGRCKVCGTFMESAIMDQPLSTTSSNGQPAANSVEANCLEANAETTWRQKDLGADPSDSAPPDLSARILCSDGTCIGVVGSDGRCRVCGKEYTGDPKY